MTKPTKTELMARRRLAIVDGDRDTIELINAYLAQEEELKRIKQLAKKEHGLIDGIVQHLQQHFPEHLPPGGWDIGAVVHSILTGYRSQEEELKGYKDENFELLRLIGQMKAENQALEQKGKLLCCRVGVLEMENQALKAQLAGTFRYQEPTRGEPLSYTIEERDG